MLGLDFTLNLLVMLKRLHVRAHSHAPSLQRLLTTLLSVHFKLQRAIMLTHALYLHEEQWIVTDYLHKEKWS